MTRTTTERRGPRVSPPHGHRSAGARVPVRVGAALRPAVVTLAAAAAVTALAVPDYHPFSPGTEYLLRAGAAVAASAAVAALWWSRRRGRTWAADLAPALVGGIAAGTLVISLHGTPYAPGGLANDQSFRTAAITRFADDWQLADFTFASLPSFYAPAYFWVLGRAADLAGAEPWRLAKVGTVAAALLVPVVTYLLWRRLVPVHTAALLALLPLVVRDVYQPYAWLVLFAIVPWWLAAVAGIRRPDRPPDRPPDRAPGRAVLLGLVGALLFLTYYYLFFIAAIALVLHLVTERALGGLRWRQVGRAALVLAVAALASAVYWLPLAASILGADHARSLANRWFTAGHAAMPLPMTDPTMVGVVALAGLVYLVWSARRDALSRGLLVLLAAAYGWYLLGAVAVGLDAPLLSYRGKPLVPLILLTGGVLGLVRLAGAAADRVTAAGAGSRAADVRRVAWVLAAVLAVYAGQQFVSAVRDSPHVARAHAEALPDGSLPPYHGDDAEVPDPPAAELRALIDARTPGLPRPVVLSDREDILALYPYPGFLQWNAHYAHPAAEFDQRVAVLAAAARAEDPAEFVTRVRDHPYRPVDVLVLRAEGDDLVLRYAADAFPRGVRTAEVRFPRELFGGGHFEVVDAGDHVVAVRR